jgi:hypothetical protein
VVQPGPFRFHEGEHVVVAAVDAVHEGDHVARAIGEAKPQHAAVELDGLRDVAGEDQHMGEPARLHMGDLAAARRAGDAGTGRRIVEGGFFVRRGLLGDRDLDRRAVGVAQPDTVRFDGCRRIQPIDPQLRQTLAKARQILFEGGERDEP